MSSEFRKEQDFKIAFVLTEKVLRDGVASLRKELRSTEVLSEHEASEPLRYTIELGSGGFSTDSIDEVFALQNSGTKRVKAVTVSTTFWVTPTVYLRYRGTGFPNSVSYSVSGDERQVFFMVAQLDEFIERTRVWYSRIAHLDMLQTLFALLATFWVFALIVAGVFALAGAFDSAPPSTPREAILANAIVVTVLVVLIILAGGLNRLRAWLFPVGVFAFGDQKDRVQKLRFRRSFFGISVITALVVNVVTTLLVGYL